jgi:hypothetical protein
MTCTRTSRAWTRRRRCAAPAGPPHRRPRRGRPLTAADAPRRADRQAQGVQQVREHSRGAGRGHRAGGLQAEQGWVRRAAARRAAAAGPACAPAEPSRSRPPAGLKKFLKKHAEGDTLAVLDSKLGSIIKEKLNIPCVYRCDRRPDRRSGGAGGSRRTRTRAPGASAARGQSRSAPSPARRHRCPVRPPQLGDHGADPRREEPDAGPHQVRGGSRRRSWHARMAAPPVAPVARERR